ncbi:aminoacyl-tRNA deacylase [Rhodobacteraceae bacterium WD3A24]|nr:aminoacyl-tRNA deacylase [Rhodobacteraceae bacterium WD3A24]
MSKSLNRVRQALAAAGVDAALLEMDGETRTAEQAAGQAGCALDQIVKSIVFSGAESGQVRLFLTAGGNRVCPDRAALLAGETLARADAAQVRAQTGFAIGGVAPLGHVTAIPCWLDERLLAFDRVWAAAGTPRHIFAIAPHELQRIAGARPARFTLARPDEPAPA